MKKLFIVRHAKASYSNELEDHQRTLTNQGIIECHNAAQFIIQQQLFPDYILCSSAVRAMATINNMMDIINLAIPIKFTNDLYQIDYQELLIKIKSVSNEYQHLMIVAHNPTIQEFFQRFAHNNENMQITTASIAYFSFAFIDDWLDIKPEAAKLEWFFNKHQ